MKPRESALAALELRIPDEVPTFELKFQLERKIHETAEYFANVCTRLKHAKPGEVTYLAPAIFHSAEWTLQDTQ